MAELHPEVDAEIAPGPLRRLPALDGVRALSVLAVVAYHLGELEGGFLGVDVFFAVSGFLITRLLLAEHERTGRIALGAFWSRRFRRLLPALLVVLAAVAVGARLWLPSFRLTDIRNDAFGALAYVANWRFVLSGQSYFQSGVVPSPLRHTWSLAIEEQFYLLWPLLVVGLCAVAGRTSARRLVDAAALVLSVASGAWMAVASAQGRDLSRLYYGTDTRLFTVCLGSWLATWWDGSLHPAGSRSERRRRTRAWSWVGAVALVPATALVAVGRTDEASFYRGGFQAMAVASVLLVGGLATGDGPVGRALGSRVPVWVGRRSYGIYLWSWPVQVFAADQLRWTGLGLDALVVGLAIGLAAVSFWLVEEPIRTGHRPWARRRVPAAAAPALARTRPAFLVPTASVAAVAALAALLAAGAPPEPSYLTVSDGDAVEAALEGVDDGPTPTAPTTVPGAELPPGPFDRSAPVLVDPTASASPEAVFGRPMAVMVAGDSVGWSLGWDLRGRLRPDVLLQDRAIIACGVLPADARYLASGREPAAYGPNCPKALAAEGTGIQEHPDVALLWIGAWEVYDQELDGVRYEVGTEAYATLLEGQLEQRIALYRAFGVPTVIPLVPCMGVGVAYLGTERLDDDRRAWVDERILAVAERNPGWVRVIDPTDRFCDAEGDARPTTPDGVALREDGVHLNAEAALWFWDTWLGGQLAAAFPADGPANAASTTTTSTPATTPTTTTSPSTTAPPG